MPHDMHFHPARPGDSKRDNMISALADRFTVNERYTLIDNGLSTVFMLCPSDLAPQRAELLRQKKRNAMSYAVNFNDVREFNALRRLPLADGKQEYFTLSLGLYLYFADECSRLKCKDSFLTAMREQDAGLDSFNMGEDYRKDLFHKIDGVLTSLGMKDYHHGILKEWFDTGGYTINGERHCLNAQDEFEGRYALLAREILGRDKKFLSPNLAISFAAGNEKHVAGLSTEEAFAHAQHLLASPARVSEIIDEGNAIRDALIDRKVQESGVTWEENHTAQASHKAAVKQARDIFSLMPDAALEILYREGYAYSLSTGSDIRNCYPVKDTPGFSHADNESCRQGSGLRMDRYRMLFISEGGLQQPEAVKDRIVVNRAMAQTLLHETMHMIIGYLNDAEKAQLWEGAAAVSAELKAMQKAKTLPASFTDRLHTMERSTLSSVLDYEHADMYGHYNKKGGKDTRREEMICNLFGLMYTEPCFQNASPENPTQCLATLQPLMGKVNEAVQVALGHCRREFAYVEPAKEAPAMAVGK